MTKTYRSLYEGEADAAGTATATNTLITPPQATGTSTTAGTPPKGYLPIEGFHAHLPDDIKADPTLGKYNNIEALARGAIHASRLVGKDPARLLELPDQIDDATITTVASRLGLPKDFKEYKVTAPQNTPPELALTTPLGQQLLTAAHKAGVLPKQFEAIYAPFAQAIAEAGKQSAAQVSQTHAKNVETLKTELGAAFDSAVSAAATGVEKTGGEELRKVLEDANLATNPAVIKAFAKIGAMYAEDTADGDGSEASGQFGRALTPAEARAKGTDLLRQANGTKDLAEKRRLNAEAQKFFAMIPEPKK